MSSTVTIEKLVYGGDGLARLNGQVVLAPFVLPGELVTLETAPAKGGLLRGSSPKIVESSEARIQPRCEYFGICGGCQYQHARYEFQLEQKVSILRETLRRLGAINFEADVPVISGDPWLYRNRVQLHFADDKSGFLRASSHELCAITHCEIAAPMLVEAIAQLQQAVRRTEWPRFVRSLELFTNGTDLQMNILDSARPVAARFFEWVKSFLPSLAPGSIEYHAAGHTFRIGGDSFFQVNRFLIDALVEEVIGETAGHSAMDLYAGVGLFSLPLSRRFKQVHAVERGASAFRDLRHNVTSAGVDTQIYKLSSEQFLEGGQHGRPDLLIADPPRAGLGKDTTERMMQLQPPQVTVVSCDPATLARDARKLLERYRIRRLALVDLFPQTYHFETVMHLEIR